ncbi:MAG TPA: hypothetical protein VLB12_00700 [Gemmatimonadales bacterium]|nr:hypothetical protein [Gemmatimonadales bacterium]HSE65471.1 hypothetical protein [Gemmatimonadales bacterium]
MIVLLAPILPAILLVALVGRSPVPPTGLPHELVDPRDPTLVPVGSEWTLLESPRIQARFLAQQGDSTPSAIALDRVQQPPPPDLLLYWAETAGDSTTLPADALLLGPLEAGKQWKLPASKRGFLILYSLAHRERVGFAELSAVPSGR